MLRPISTLKLTQIQMSTLQRNGFNYVDDIVNNPELFIKLGGEQESLFTLPKMVSALDILQEESQTDVLTTSVSALDHILNGGFRCGTVTEFAGRTSSAKTQLCLQACLSVQKSQNDGGLEGKAFYIDTRNGFSPLRLQDLINSSKTQKMSEKEMLQNVIVSSPVSVEELYNVIQSLKDANLRKHNIRLLVIDSLSYPIQCIINPTTRTQLYFQIMNHIREIQAKNNLVVLIVNELSTHLNSQGKLGFKSAGGNLLAHRIHTKIRCKRQDENIFTATILKNPLSPQTTILFKVTNKGIEDIT